MQILWRGKRIGCETASTAWERTKYLKSYHCVFRNMSVFWSIHGSFALAAHTSRTFLALGGASSTIFSGGNLFLAEISHGKIHASVEKNLWGFFPAENFFLRHPPKNFFRPLLRFFSHLLFDGFDVRFSLKPQQHALSPRWPPCA